MKRLRLFRFLLLLLTAFVLILNSTNAEVRLQPVAKDGVSLMNASQLSMKMAGEEHCDGCPDSGQSLPAAAPCIKCIPWMHVQLFTPAMVPFFHPQYVPFIQPLSWIDYQSLPWKPPRSAVLNG